MAFYSPITWPAMKMKRTTLKRNEKRKLRGTGMGSAGRRPHLEFLETRLLLAADIFEPNDSRLEAADLGTSNNTYANLSIDPEGDVDWYKWTAPNNGVVRVDAFFDADDGDIDMKLYRAPNFENPVDTSNSLDDNERVRASVTAGDLMYFRLVEFSGFLTPEYSLKVQLIRPDSIDATTPNNTLGTAYNLGTSDATLSNLNIHNPSDVDYFAWTATIDGRLDVTADFRHDDGDLVLSVLTPAGAELTSADTKTDNESVTLNVYAGETYVFKVREANALEQPNYSLRSRFTAFPTISDIPPVLGPIGGTTLVNFTVNDADTPLSLLTLSGTSSEPWLVPDSNISFIGSGSNRTAVITGNPGVFGFTDITITVSDLDGNSASETFQLGLWLSNQAPQISDIGNISIAKNSSSDIIPFTVNDSQTPASELVVTASSSNTSLIPDGNIVLGGSGTDRTIRVTPATNQIGTAVITVIVTDGSSASASDTFLVDVINIASPPTISPISDRTINEDTSTGPIPFTVADADTPVSLLTVTASSSDVSIIPNSGIVISGTDANRTVSVSPSANATGGPVTITLTVSDGTGFTTETFNVTVTPVNDPPTISEIADVTISEDTSTGTLIVTLNDPDSPLSSLALTATSSNQQLIPNSNISLGGTHGTRTLTITPAANAYGGPATITLTVSDGSSLTTETFNVTVTPVNDPPTISAIADLTISEDTSTGPLAFTLSDPDTPLTALTVSASSSNQTLIPNANITLVGSGANWTVTATPAANAFGGPATITLTVSDGINSSTETFGVTVLFVNDPPTISSIDDVTIDEDASTGPLDFTLSDLDTPLSFLIVTVNSSNPSLVPLGNIALAGTGANRTVTVTPVANVNEGSSVITLFVSDGMAVASESFTVTVTPVNDPPTISSIDDVAISEDTSTGPLSFTLSDLDTPLDSLTLTASSSNQTLIPNANIVFGGSGASRTVTVTPSANAFGGPATITVTVSDGTSSVNETFRVTVTSVNDPPAISAISNITINEDTSTGPLAFTVADLDTSVETLTVTANSSNQTLIPNANIVLGGSGANRTVTVTPVANASGGPATITLTVSDGVSSATETFDVTVNPVNDPPTISSVGDITISEDTSTGPLAFTLNDPDTPLNSLTLTATSSNRTLIPDANVVFGGSGASRTVTVTPAANANGGPATITLTVSDGVNTVTEVFDVTVTAVNDPPAISEVGNLTISEDTSTGPLAFTLSDPDTPLTSLTVTANSNNQTLIPYANIVLGGSGASRTVTVTPAANANGGPATITLTVSDGTSSSTETFQVTVTAVDDPPSISPIGDVAINEDTSTGPLAFALSDPDTSLTSLTVTATSSNQTLIPDANIVLGGIGASRTVLVTPAPNANGGPATITLTVSDGTSSSTETFQVTVAAIDDPPTISAVGDVTINEDTSTGPLAFTLSDPDTPLASLTVTATSSNQTLIPNENIVFGGTGANRTVNVTPTANANGGPATITLTVSDGTSSATETFQVTVAAVDDPPTVSAVGDVTIPEDTSTGPLSFTVTDPDTPLNTLTLTAVSSDQALIPDANLVVGGAGTDRTVTVTPVPNSFGGPVTVTLSVSDGTTTSTGTFLVTVTPVDDAPTISALSDVTIDEDTPTAPLAFTVNDLDTPLESLILTVASDDQTLVPDANIVVGGSGANRTLTVTPAANANGGPVTITVSVSDGTSSATETFDLTVTPVNDPPTISEIGDQSTSEDTPTPAIAFTVFDLETPPAELIVTVLSSNPSLVPVENITLGGTNGNRTIELTPLANQTGTSTITVTVTDAGSASAATTFVLTVGSTDDPPEISALEDVTIDEDTSTAPLPFTIGDLDTPLESLTLTASSSDPALVPDANIVIEGSGANRTVTVTPVANANGGPVTITVSVSDETSSSTETFNVTVTPVDDAPTISALSDVTIDEDTPTAPLAFTVNDLDTPLESLILTVASDDQTLVPDANIVVGGSGANRTLTVTPAANANGGPVTITVSVSDGTSSATETFDLTVTPVNDPPTISEIGDQSTSEDTPTPAIAFTVFDLETPPAELIVTVLSSNPSLVPVENITLGGTNGNRTIELTPLANQTGTSTITVTVTDAGSASAATTFVLTVGSTDDPPEISALEDVTIDEDTSTAPLPFTIGDLDTPLESLTLTASSSDPALVPDANIVIEGSGANRTVTVTPVANANGGPVTITLSVSDGKNTTIETFQVTVASVNDPPTISPIADQTVLSGASTGEIPFIVADIDDASTTLTVEATSDNEDLIPLDRIVVAGDGSDRSVSITPRSGQPGGLVQVTLTVSDGTDIATESFTVTVTPAVIGDANNDGLFNTADLVAVLTAGEYEDGIEGNSVWEEGDWNGDGDFDTGDLVYALQAGTYELGVQPARPLITPASTPDSDLSAELVDLAIATDDVWDLTDLFPSSRKK